MTHSINPWEKIWESCLRILLNDSAAAHKRRCAIRQGRREADTENCSHDWDITKGWCRKCGLTKFDILSENRNDPLTRP